MLASKRSTNIGTREEKSDSPSKPSGTQGQEGVCPCSRPKTRFFCTSCGYIGEGRIRCPCDKHINVTFINDFSHCPMCKVHGFMLHEF